MISPLFSNNHTQTLLSQSASECHFLLKRLLLFDLLLLPLILLSSSLLPSFYLYAPLSISVSISISVSLSLSLSLQLSFEQLNRCEFSPRITVGTGEGQMCGLVQLFCCSLDGCEWASEARFGSRLSSGPILVATRHKLCLGAIAKV